MRDRSRPGNAVGAQLHYYGAGWRGKTDDEADNGGEGAAASYGDQLQRIVDTIDRGDLSSDDMAQLLEEARAICSAMRGDRGVSKRAVIALAEQLGASRYRGGSRDEMVEEVVRQVATRIYDIEAQRLANRATPW